MWNTSNKHRKKIGVVEKNGMGNRKRAKRSWCNWVFLEWENIVHWKQLLVYISSNNIILCIIYLRVVRKVGARIPNSIQSKCVFVCVRCSLFVVCCRKISFVFRIIFLSFHFVSFACTFLVDTPISSVSICSSAFDLCIVFCHVCLASVWVLIHLRFDLLLSL